MTVENLFELRTKIKENKPDFIRQDYQRRKRLGRKLKWRKPKGIHSKIRHHFKGRRKMPSPGYKSPKRIKGLHASGLKMIRVFSLNDMAKINKESEGIVISKSIGIKKKLEILKKVKELNVTVLNLNLDEYIKKIEDFVTSKIKAYAKEIKKVEIKEEKEVKPKESKDKVVISDIEKKESEKKEKDKILTRKV